MLLLKIIDTRIAFIHIVHLRLDSSLIKMSFSGPFFFLWDYCINVSWTRQMRCLFQMMTAENVDWPKIQVNYSFYRFWIRTLMHIKINEMPVEQFILICRYKWEPMINSITYQFTELIGKEIQFRNFHFHSASWTLLNQRRLSE